MTRPEPWTGPGNDYRGIKELKPNPAPSLAVFVLGNTGRQDTLQGLQTQVYDGELIISSDSDDGAEDADVVAFLASGQIPAPDWAERHAFWHRRADNLVVIGEASGEADAAVIRGTRQLLSSDEAFRAFPNTNVSLRAEDWRDYQSLDLIKAWQLWNAGRFLIHEPNAKVIGGQTGQDSRADTADPLVLEDLIPHRSYRHRSSPIHSVPKISWVVGAGTPKEAERAWQTCLESSFSDHELIIFGPVEATGSLREIAESNPRLTTVEDDNTPFASAVRAARGELIALYDANVEIAPESLDKALSRFRENPGAPLIRFGYRIDGDRYLRLDDLAAVDAALGQNSLPLFAVVTRRELMKNARALDDPAGAWSALLDRTDMSLVVSPTVEIPGDTPVRPRFPGVRDITSMSVRELAKEVVREARRMAGSVEATDVVSTNGERVSVAYVGFTGHNNLGDEAVKVAIERLMPWARFEPEPTDPRLLMVGGGTLINGRRYYLTRMLRQESAAVERALFGTGVRSPEYWGVTEPMDDWFSFIDSCVFAAVRGPDSVKNLRTLGYDRDLPIIGDPALSLRPPDEVGPDGSVVICPVYTSGNLHGKSDEVVFNALAELIRRIRAEGRETVMLSAFPQDDRWVIDLMRRAGAPDMHYVAGYENIDDTMRLLAGADIVVGERLHAAIMAAAAGTPFVGLEYRPKMRDFARSVGQESAVLRTDEMDQLESVFDRVVARSDEIVDEMGGYVERFRALQERAAGELRNRFTTS